METDSRDKDAIAEILARCEKRMGTDRSSIENDLLISRLREALFWVRRRAAEDERER